MNTKQAYDEILGRFAVKQAVSKTQYKKLFNRIKADAIKLPSSMSVVKAFGKAAEKYGLKGYSDFEELAQLAGEHLSTSLPQAASKGWEERIEKALKKV
jgi:hypothetical protein